MGAGAGFEPAALRGKGGANAHWDAQKVSELALVVEGWGELSPELRVAILAIVASAKGERRG